jgi:hypothetical protein
LGAYLGSTAGAQKPFDPNMPTVAQQDYYFGGAQAFDSPYSAALADKVQVAKGSTNLQIYWTVTITAARKLKNAKVEKVELGETIWE